jgi:hypothetical protein
VAAEGAVLRAFLVGCSCPPSTPGARSARASPISGSAGAYEYTAAADNAGEDPEEERIAYCTTYDQCMAIVS